MAIAFSGLSHHSMNAAAAALCLAVTGIERPSGRPNEQPGPSMPGPSPSSALPAMLDCFVSLATGMLPGPVASTLAFSPAVNLLKATESSCETEPGETHPVLHASPHTR